MNLDNLEVGDYISVTVGSTKVQGNVSRRTHIAGKTFSFVVEPFYFAVNDGKAEFYESDIAHSVTINAFGKVKTYAEINNGQ